MRGVLYRTLDLLSTPSFKFYSLLQSELLVCSRIKDPLLSPKLLIVALNGDSPDAAFERIAWPPHSALTSVAVYSLSTSSYAYIYAWM